MARVAALPAAAAIGWAVARLLDLHSVHQSSGYLYFVTALLALGIYGSTRGIPRAELERNARVVLLAVTLGVLMKAALISGVMGLVFGDPAYAVLGMVVAQIDPLSVAALRSRSRMSDSAKVVLSAWSSFDDPITVLLTIYVSAFALRAQGNGGAADGVLFGGDLPSFGVNLVMNLAFAGCTFAAWALVWFARQRLGSLRAARGRAARRGGQVAALLALFTIGAIAVADSLMLGLAIIGLFFRPAIGEIVERMTRVALLVATFALGLVLVDGVNLLPGIVLGVAAYGAQVITALLVARRQPPRDLVYLALSQQNGLTAIILALLLEPTFPETVAIVAPAILVVNLLHATCNGVWHRVEGNIWPPPGVSETPDSGGSATLPPS